MNKKCDAGKKNHKSDTNIKNFPTFMNKSIPALLQTQRPRYKVN